MSTRRLLRILTATLVAAFLAAACAPQPPPPPYRTVPDTWGASLAPSRVDVAYGPHAAHRLDVYRSTSGPRRGTIVVVHGGGWAHGSKNQRDQLPRVLLAQTHRGYDLVAINYRLSGAAPYPAAVQDVGRAVSWLRANGAGIGLDTRRVVVAGLSAGAHLATLAGVAANNATAIGDLPRVDGIVALAGVHDLERPGFATPPGWMSPHQRRDASPVRWLDRHDPPVFAVHGVEDGIVTVEQLRHLARRGRDVGARVTSIEVSHRGLPASCRNHMVSCGVPADQLEHFLDRL